MSNTAYLTGGKPIAILSQSIWGVNDINPLVAFYDIPGRKRVIILFYLFIVFIEHCVQSGTRIYVLSTSTKTNELDYSSYKINLHTHCTVNSTLDYTLWTFYLSYFAGISANIELSDVNFRNYNRARLRRLWRIEVAFLNTQIKRHLFLLFIDIAKGD
jgi:hypothetical protein